MQSNTLVNLQHDPDQYLITPEMLAQSNCLGQYGGIGNIACALRTNLDAGIIGDPTDLKSRREVFGSNMSSTWRPPEPHTIKRIVGDALRDTTILLLLCCAMLSLAIRIKTNGEAEAVIDAALFLLAMSFVVCFGAAARFLRERWMLRRSLKWNDHVRVVRNGVVVVIPESQLVVGDIVWLNTGDRVPADGIFINGDDSFELGKDYSQHPCLFSGGQVVRGRCRMLVTAVGENTERSRLIRSIGIPRPQNDRLQLLDAIEKTSSKFDKIWLSLSLIFLVVQFVRCFVEKKVRDRNLDPKGVKDRMEDLMKEVVKKERLKAKGLVTMMCVLLFASREGLPLALFVSLLYASNRIKFCKAIVGQLQASATVGLITTICTCKTADLDLQHSKMAELWIGFELVHHHLQGRTDTQILDALRRGISLHGQPHGGVEEICLLSWARAVLGLNMDCFPQDSSMVRYQMDTNLCCCSIVKREGEEADKLVVHVHWRGSPHSILSMCSHYYTVDGKIETLDAVKATAFNQIVDGCDQCCFAFAYKREICDEDDDIKTLQSDLTLLGLVCLKNPYSAEVKQAIEDCRKSRVEVKLVVDDDIDTARIIAVYSGLVRRGDDDNSGGAIVDAGDFRSSSEAERLNMVDNIIVMANASPADKMLMVRCLRQKRHVVAVAAAAIRDSPLLKQADVGIFMGPRLTSNEDADIVVPDSNFSQIPEIVNLGRRVCTSLENIVQRQLTMEISAFTINIVSVAATSKVALSSCQVLWINLIMEILGAVAVAITTVGASSSRANANPVYGSGRIITRPMCTIIAVQSFFQVAVILVMLTKGKTVFQVNESAVETMIFNCYAFCQVFLLIPAIDMKRGHATPGRSCLFLSIVAIIGILQVAVVEIVGVVARRPRLDMKLWCICIGISSLSLPFNCVANWIIRISRLM